MISTPILDRIIGEVRTPTLDFKKLCQLIEAVQRDIDPYTLPDGSPGATAAQEIRSINLSAFRRMGTEISVGQSVDSADRKLFETWLAKIAPGQDPRSKFLSIQNFIDNMSTGIAKEGALTSEVLSHLMFLENFSMILTEFNAAVAGFLWEPLLAALVGGASVQVPTSAHDLADVRVEDIIQVTIPGEKITPGSGLAPWSLKVLRPEGNCGGSFGDMVKFFRGDITGTPEDKMTYLVLNKYPPQAPLAEASDSEDAEDDDPRLGLGEIRCFAFDITLDTLFNWIGHESHGEFAHFEPAEDGAYAKTDFPLLWIADGTFNTPEAAGFTFAGAPTETTIDGETITIPGDTLRVRLATYQKKERTTGWKEYDVARWNPAEGFVVRGLKAQRVHVLGEDPTIIGGALGLSTPDGAPVKPKDILSIGTEYSGFVPSKNKDTGDLELDWAPDTYKTKPRKNLSHMWGESLEKLSIASRDLTIKTIPKKYWKDKDGEPTQDPRIAFWSYVAAVAPGASRGGHTQFEIEPKHYQRKENLIAVWKMDAESLNRIRATAANSIGNAVTMIFNSLADLVDHLSFYFMLECGGRKRPCTKKNKNERMQFGHRAICDLEQLKVATDAAVGDELPKASACNIEEI